MTATTTAATDATTKSDTKEPAQKETAKPKTDEAVHVMRRQWAKVVKSPDAYEGRQYAIYGQVTEFDSATEADTFRADTAHKTQLMTAHRDTTDDGIFDGKAALLTGDEADLSDLVEDDVFRATVTVIGSSDKETDRSEYHGAPSESRQVGGRRQQRLNLAGGSWRTSFHPSAFSLILSGTSNTQVAGKVSSQLEPGTVLHWGTCRHVTHECDSPVLKPMGSRIWLEYDIGARRRSQLIQRNQRVSLPAKLAHRPAMCGAFGADVVVVCAASRRAYMCALAK
jgi:hypothetical protein